MKMFSICLSFFGAGAFFAWAIVHLAEDSDGARFWMYVRWFIISLALGVFTIFVRR